MKNLLLQRGSMVSRNSAAISKMGKSEHNLYKSLMVSQVDNLDYLVDVEEMSDISTSRMENCDKTDIEAFRPQKPTPRANNNLQVVAVTKDSFETSSQSSGYYAKNSKNISLATGVNQFGFDHDATESANASMNLPSSIIPEYAGVKRV